MSSSGHLSKDFFELVKSIGESKSKQEEDKIIGQEMHVLKQKMAAKSVSSKRMKEYLIRMIYVEMLGHDASFGHIHAIKMTHGGTLAERRVGYMACSLCLHNDHELMLLLVGGLQTDLQSDNHLEVATALIVVCKLVNRDTIPAVLPLVVKLLDHPQANVRKKAVMALHRFNQIDGDCCLSLIDKLKRILCDKNPSVMGAALYLLDDLSGTNITIYKDLVPSFVSILKQITEHRLPRDYDYHRMPAPWIQIKLLQILRGLGTADKSASEGMYEVLQEVMRRADIGINVGYAIIYECVRTVTSIYPNNTLLEEAAKCTSRFITSENHNLKYLGINALASIVQVNAKYAAEHQLVVIDCLEDSDETLRRKTLDLLFRMTNPANVEIIVDKLTAFLKSTVDVYLRSELVSKITQLAERYAPNNAWYIQTMNTVFELGGDLVRPEVAHNVMRLIAEGANDIDDDGNDVGEYAVDTYLLLLDKPALPGILLKVISWVLGEYGQLSSAFSRMDIIHKLWEVIENQHDNTSEIRSWALTAMMKLAARMSSVPPEVMEIVSRYQSSVSSDLQQRSHEFIELCKDMETMRSVLPEDASAEEIDVESNLHFLDEYVEEALGNGASPYIETDGGLDFGDAAETQELNVQPYAAPDSSTTVVMDPAPRSSYDDNDPYGSSIARDTSRDNASQLKISGPKVWGPNSSSGTSALPVRKHSQELEDDLPYVNEPDEDRDRTGSMDSSPSSEDSGPASPVKTRKEQFAHDLFAGIVDGGSRKSKKTKPKKRFKKREQREQRERERAKRQQERDRRRRSYEDEEEEEPRGQPAQQSAQPKTEDTEDLVDDLLNLSSLMDSQPTQSTQPAASSSGDILDMFDFSVPQTQPEPQQAAQPTTAPASGVDDFDLLGGMGSTNAAPATSEVKEQSGPPDLMDFAGLSIGGTPSAASSGALGLNIKYGSKGVSSAMANKLATVPKSQVDDEILANDGALQISSYKIWGPNEPVVTLFISNLAGYAINNVTVQAQVISGLVVTFDAASAEPQTLVKGGNCITIETIPAHGTSTQFATVRSHKSSAISHSQFDGYVTYEAQGQQSSLQFYATLQIPDFMRPQPITTDQFGSSWKQLMQESKTQMRSSCSTMLECEQRIKSRLNAHHVQTIGQEVIACGKLLMSPQTLLCLIHVKVNLGGLDIIVKSSYQDATNNVANFVKIVMA